MKQKMFSAVAVMDPAEVLRLAATFAKQLGAEGAAFCEAVYAGRVPLDVDGPVLRDALDRILGPRTDEHRRLVSVEPAGGGRWRLLFLVRDDVPIRVLVTHFGTHAEVEINGPLPSYGFAYLAWCFGGEDRTWDFCEVTPSANEDARPIFERLVVNLRPHELAKILL